MSNENNAAPPVVAGEHDGLIKQARFAATAGSSSSPFPHMILTLADALAALQVQRDNAVIIGQHAQARIAALEEELAFHTCRPFVSGTGRDPITRQIRRMTVVDDETKASTTYVPDADAQARIAVLEEALDRHGKHDSLCAIVGGYGYCTCGLDDARAALKGGDT